MADDKNPKRTTNRDVLRPKTPAPGVSVSSSNEFETEETTGAIELLPPYEKAAAYAKRSDKISKVTYDGVETLRLEVNNHVERLDNKMDEGFKDVGKKVGEVKESVAGIKGAVDTWTKVLQADRETKHELTVTRYAGQVAVDTQTKILDKKDEIDAKKFRRKLILQVGAIFATAGGSIGWLVHWLMSR